MRHQISGRKFSRTSAHRKAMFANMCTSLVEHELIKTTLAKAKDLRRYFEPLVTVAKRDSVAARRYVFDRLRSKAAVGKLFTDLGPRFKERPGGYISIIKCGYRQGDNAPMAIVRLMDRPEEVEVDVEEEVVIEEPKKAKKAKEVKDSTENSESKTTKPSKSSKAPKASNE